MTACPGCDRGSPDGSRFCIYCGQSLANVTTSGVDDDLTQGRLIPEIDSAPGSRPASRATYLWALLGIVGALIGWLAVRDRDPRLGRNVLIAGAAVSAAGLLLTVGFNLVALNWLTGASTTVTDTAATDETIPEPSLAGEGIDVAFVTTMTEFGWTYRDDVDATLLVSGTINEPVRASQNPYVTEDLTEYTPGEACGMIDDSIGLVPITFAVENASTSDATAELAFSLNVRYERYFSDGPECYEADQVSSGSWENLLTPGESVNTTAVALVPGYSGDPSSLQNLRLTAANTDFWGVSALTGPTVIEPDSFALTAGPDTGSSGTLETSETDMSGTYTGTMTATKGGAVYDLVLELEQAGSDVTAIVTATSRETGNRGSYTASGYSEGGRIVLNGESWIDKPNSTWFMDHLDLTADGDVMTGSFAALDAPAKPLGSVYVSR